MNDPGLSRTYRTSATRDKLARHGLGSAGASSERTQTGRPRSQAGGQKSPHSHFEPRVAPLVTSRAGPRGHWLWGSLPELRLDMLAFFTRCAREYGDLAPIRFANRRIALVSDPAAIEQVLVTENRRFEKHYAIQLLRPILGNGLLNNEGESWLRQRRLCQPAFARDRIEGYGASMVSLAETLLADWRNEPRRDLHQDMMRLTLDIAAKTLLDVDVGSESRVVSEAIDVIMEDFLTRFQSALPLPLWIPTPGNLRVRRAIAGLERLIQKIIESRRSSGQDHGDLLSQLVHARDVDDGRGMTDRQLRDEVMTMFLAGHETTAVTLSWTWFLLGQHPEVEARLLREFEAVLAGRSPTVADVPKLVYCERVVREALRLYPPAFIIGRRAKEPVEIGGLLIPRGTSVLMSQWVVHRDERWFADPLAFLPDRWEPNLASRLPKYAYFPFGGGPRICIGNQFAMFEAILILATILPKFRVELDKTHKVTPWPAVTLRPAAGILAAVCRRSNILEKQPATV